MFLAALVKKYGRVIAIFLVKGFSRENSRRFKPNSSVLNEDFAGLKHFALPRATHHAYHASPVHFAKRGGMRKISTLAVLLVVAVCVATAWAEDRHHDFGSPDDFSDKNEIHFPKPDINLWFWGIKNPDEFIQYENDEEFRWATPGNAIDFTTARVLKSFHSGIFYVKAINWGNDIHLAIRYKDNLMAPVSLWTKNEKESYKIGGFGGAFDHKWKTAVFKYPRMQSASFNGWFAFRISSADVSDLVGDLPIDWIRLANEEIPAPKEAPGFWPKVPKSKFDDIGRTMVYKKGGKPRFIVGAIVKGMREKSWKKFADAGCNHLNFQPWGMNWKRNWEIYRDGAFFDRARFGFPDWNEACAEAGLTCTVQFFTDTKAPWIKSRYSKESEMLRVVEDVVKFNRNSKSNLAWFTFNEPDHDDPAWGAPLEFAMQTTKRIREADPDSPIIYLFQAEKPRVYEYYRQGYDIAVFHAYPLGANRPVTQITDMIDAMHRQVGDTKALWACVEGQGGRTSRKLAASEILLQGYISIAHAVQGVLFYLDYEGSYLDLSYIPNAWEGMQQFFTEITSKENGIESFLTPPAVVVDAMGSSGTVKAPENIHFTLRRRDDGRCALITVNASLQPVKARIAVEGLPALRDVEVRFENRSITSMSNMIEDNFKPYERHVYIFEMNRTTP